jgi:hypothetical protein
VAGESTPGHFSTRSFPVAFFPLRDHRAHCGTVNFHGKRGGSLPLKSINSSPSPSLLFQSSCSSSPLPWIPSMLYPPLLPQGRSHVEGGTTRQGHVVCFGRIKKPREGLRYSEEGDRPTSTCGPFKQQRRQPLTGEA